MKATTKMQAERIAQAGAAKMSAEKYTIKNSAFAALYGRQFMVINRESGARYTVSIDPEKTFCACPFFQENREFGICKHLVKAREEAAWQASVEARAAEWMPIDRIG